MRLSNLNRWLTNFSGVSLPWAVVSLFVRSGRRWPSAFEVRCGSVGRLLRSEVAAPLEVGGHLWSRQLIERDLVAARTAKRAARPMRDLQGLLPLPPVGL
jgi:hypothetical protein